MDVHPPKYGNNMFLMGQNRSSSSNTGTKVEYTLNGYD